MLADAIDKLVRLTHANVTDLGDGRKLVSQAGVQQYIALQEPPRPWYVDGTVELFSAESLVKYFNKFKTPHSVIFADPVEQSLTAIIDYHKAPGSAGGGDGERVPASPEADRTKHRARLSVKYSDQWLRWRAIDGKTLSQMEFAEFIEENYMEVVAPAHADLLECVTTLSAKNDVTFSSGVKLQNGEIQFQYVEKIDGKGRGGLTVPSEIVLRLPLHLEGPVQEVRCLLRYRIINQGQLTFIVKIVRREIIEREAFIAVVRDVTEKTAVAPYIGAPTR